uniref:Uncharacterized protein n=1 Tax=Anguilla anguilla TaxID=7936 RepID=A0A0E9WQN0_ANGAN
MCKHRGCVPYPVYHMYQSIFFYIDFYVSRHGTLLSHFVLFIS